MKTSVVFALACAASSTASLLHPGQARVYVFAAAEDHDGFQVVSATLYTQRLQQHEERQGERSDGGIAANADRDRGEPR